MKNDRFNINKRMAFIVLIIPIVFISQYYLFKFGVINPQIKGIEVSAVKGKYIKDIDKYVVKLNEEVIFSTGDYVKFPSYGKDPVVEFKSLDKDNIVKIEDNSENIKNTFKITGIKKGIASIAVVKNNRILKKFNILVVDPKVVELNTEINGSLRYVGDKATIKNTVEVDFDRFNEKYEVDYKSSNQNVLKVEDDKIYAVGVGKATITANLGSKKESFTYNIVARIKDIIVEKNINLKVGEKKSIDVLVKTLPEDLKTPRPKFTFSESKLPVQRNIRLDDDGTIIGLREGVEKVLVSCGSGKNKIEKHISITVKNNI
ncbi:MAG: hypothetical protein ACI3VR_10150 [Intestinibacter sp.]|uniref:hypothetical protein n=1 Tax=Intestinibacter sp. TaxID=1965304 RepID=UPI003F1642F2